jgi:hypothetical protein
MHIWEKRRPLSFRIWTRTVELDATTLRCRTGGPPCNRAESDYQTMRKEDRDRVLEVAARRVAACRGGLTLVVQEQGQRHGVDQF